MNDQQMLWEIYRYSPGWWIALVMMLSLLAGSVLNCVIFRLPLMLKRRWREEAADLLGQPNPGGSPTGSYNLFVPRSSCPECSTVIPLYYNIPLFGWLWLRGRCHHCNRGISLRYPLVELICALIGGWIAYRYPPGLGCAALLLFSWLLLALFFIDLQNYLLPDVLTLPLLWLGLLVNLRGEFAPLADAVIGAACGYLALWSLYWLFKWLTGKEGMGFGDLKLSAALGAWAGWQSLPTILFIAACAGVVITLGLRLLKRGPKSDLIPFGVYLAPAGWLVLNQPVIYHSLFTGY